MGFEARLLSMFFPGGLLIIAGGFLLDVVPELGSAVATVGFVLLIVWPIVSIIARIRHRGKLRLRDHSLAGGRDSSTAVDDVHDPLHAFVSAIEFLTLVVAVPSSVLGGLGALFLVTAGDEPDLAWLKVIAGIGLLGLLGAYLLILVRGRNQQTLRIIGAAIGVCGLAGFFAVIAVIREEGVTGLGDVVMAVACVGLVAAGGWLAITGRNTVTSAD